MQLLCPEKKALETELTSFATESSILNALQSPSLKLLYKFFLASKYLLPSISMFRSLLS